MGVRQVLKPGEKHPLPAGLKGKIRYLSYNPEVKINIPGAFSSTTINFGASLECDKSDNPEELRVMLMKWVDEVIDEVSDQRYQYWAEKLGKTTD